MSTRIAGISMGPRNPVCLTPVSTPLSQLAGDVWKTWSWESVMGPHFEPCLLTLSPEFLIVTGDLCKVCWKINSLDYSNIIASMPFLKKLFFLAALDRLCFVWAFSGCGQQGLLFTVMCRRLTVVASYCGAQAPGARTSVAAACRL